VGHQRGRAQVAQSADRGKMMTWFETLVGFPETPDQIRENLILEGETLTSRANGRTFRCGRLETPSLGELRERVGAGPHLPGRLTVRKVVADVKDLHAAPSNAGSLFQVASQFNLLEMKNQWVTPEAGIGIYEGDPTQGPACAIAAGAGTIYRAYFAPVNGRIGQSTGNQIDCLADIGEALGNTGQRLWKMQNGYAMATREGLVEISERLAALSEEELDQLRQRLRIGIQWDTQVTIEDAVHTVTQAYCSALPVGCCTHPPDLWASFAQLVLDAAYEATLCAAILNALHTGSPRVFLTLVGGWAFGNDIAWITKSLHRALKRYEDWGLEVAIVSYKASNPAVADLAAQFARSAAE